MTQIPVIFRAAKPDEYESVLRELRSIYERDGDSLKVMSRRGKGN